MLYWFKRTRQPDPGTLAYAFEPRFSLPHFRIPGNGISVLFDYRPTQMPQVYVTQSIPLASYAGGGFVAGQIFGQSLLNPTGP